jgi:muconolactone delta-isomerase
MINDRHFWRAASGEWVRFSFFRYYDTSSMVLINMNYRTPRISQELSSFGAVGLLYRSTGVELRKMILSAER